MQLGRYKVRKELGRGGMGIVYLADDPVLERPVAVKVLTTAGRKDVHSEARQRLLREARVSARLDHPFVIHLLDVGSEEGSDFLVMEFVRGETLRARLESALPPVPETVRLFWEICQGVAYAHHSGIVHRDLKPDNVMVTQEGHVKIMDFGLAWQQDQARLTRDGDVMGTLAYFAPEQASGKQADARSDIYSLGAVLFEMLTGRFVFEAATVVSMLEQVINHPAPTPRIYDQTIPPALETLVLRCLSKKPEDRFQTVKELITALETFMTATQVSTGPLAADGCPAPPAPRPAPRDPNWDRVQHALAQMQKDHIVNTAAVVSPTPARPSPPPAPAPAPPVKVATPVPSTADSPPPAAVRAKRAASGRYPTGRTLAGEATVLPAVAQQQSSPAWRRVSEAYLRQGRPAEAAATLEDAVHRESDNVDLWRKLGQACAQQGNYARAEEACRQALRLNPKDAVTQVELSRMYQAQGRTQAALQALQAAVQAQPDRPEVAEQVAVWQIRQNDVKRAVAALQKAAEQHPGDARLQWNLGDLCLADGQPERAVQAFEQALAANPAIALNPHLPRLEVSSAVLAEHRQAVEASPCDAAAREHLALAYCAANQRGLAIDELSKAVMLANDNVQYHVVLGVTCELESRLEDAVHALKRAVELAPSDGLALGLLGRVYLRQGMANLAHQTLDRAVALQPRLPLLRIYLAQVLENLGDAAAANVHRQEAANLARQDVKERLAAN